MLLDTHVLLWLAGEPRRLSRPAASALRRAKTGVGIASISLWEIALLHRRGRIRGGGSPQRFIRMLLEGSRFRVHEIDAEIADVASGLGGGFPEDPCDRLIAATAIVLGLPLVTADQGIRGSGALRTVW